MSNLPAGTLLQHLLFVFLLVIAPAWDYSYTRRLKRDPSSARKIGVYRTLCAWLWISTAVACVAVGFRPLFTISLAPGEIPWLRIAWVRALVEAILVLFVIGVLLPYATVTWKKLTGRPRTYASAKALEAMAWFLPWTANERRWFAIVSLTAAVCEELLFRGFLLYYLHVFPWHLPLTPVLFIAAAIFGLQHLYQGGAGTVVTSLMGLLVSLLFLLTGSLLAPMVLHAVMDLRMLVILPAEAAG
jgi:membrane protease YdiL (CAAX protease family)